MSDTANQFEEFEDFDDECWNCGGEGYVLADCFEDTCPCADPESQHDWIPCEICNREAQ